MIGASTLAGTFLCTPLLQSLLRLYPNAALHNDVAGLRRAVLEPLRRGTAVMLLGILLGGAVYAQRNDVGYASIFALAGLAVIDVARNVETTLATAARRQRTVAVWLAAEAWSRVACSVLAVIVGGPSTTSVLIGYFTGSAIVFVGARLLVEGDARSTRECDPSVEASQWRTRVKQYAVPLVPLAIVGWVSSLSDRYIVAGVLGLREVGIYAAVYGLLNRAVMTGANTFLTTLRPVYYEAVASGHSARAQHVLRLWLLSLSGALFIGVVCVTLFRREFEQLLLGAEYQGSSELLPMLAIGFSLLALSQVFSTVSLAHNRGTNVFLAELIGAVASIVTVIPMTRVYGLTGTAAAVPIYYACQLLLAWWLAIHRRDSA
jgi:O-antigen/teichoic acid export membrane protein